ncbi:MAG: hypothetical protein AB1746_03200 [Candidatus Zixiibacteriota bacterium]
MKKVTSIFFVFLFACMLGAGLSTFLADKAIASDPPFCDIFEHEDYTCDTGPNCTNPEYPYYWYVSWDKAYCPEDQWAGCWNGLWMCE